MDTTKLKAALATAQTELNALIDAEFKARRITSLRPLTLAGNALTLVETHVGKAEARAAGKAETAEADKGGAAPAKKAAAAK